MSDAGPNGAYAIVISSVQSAEVVTAAAEALGFCCGIEPAVAERILGKAPIILFRGIPADDIEFVRPHLTTLSLYGIDFKISQKPLDELPKVNWPGPPDLRLMFSAPPPPAEPPAEPPAKTNSAEYRSEIQALRDAQDALAAENAALRDELGAVAAPAEMQVHRPKASADFRDEEFGNHAPFDAAAAFPDVAGPATLDAFGEAVPTAPAGEALPLTSPFVILEPSTKLGDAAAPPPGLAPAEAPAAPPDAATDNRPEANRPEEIRPEESEEIHLYRSDPRLRALLEDPSDAQPPEAVVAGPLKNEAPIAPGEEIDAAPLEPDLAGVVATRLTDSEVEVEVLDDLEDVPTLPEDSARITHVVRSMDPHLLPPHLQSGATPFGGSAAPPSEPEGVMDVPIEPASAEVPTVVSTAGVPRAPRAAAPAPAPGAPRAPRPISQAGVTPAPAPPRRPATAGAPISPARAPLAATPAPPVVVPTPAIADAALDLDADLEDELGELGIDDGAIDGLEVGETATFETIPTPVKPPATSDLGLDEPLGASASKAPNPADGIVSMTDELEPWTGSARKHREPGHSATTSAEAEEIPDAVPVQDAPGGALVDELKDDAEQDAAAAAQAAESAAAALIAKSSELEPWTGRARTYEDPDLVSGQKSTKKSTKKSATAKQTAAAKNATAARDATPMKSATARLRGARSGTSRVAKTTTGKSAAKKSGAGASPASSKALKRRGRSLTRSTSAKRPALPEPEAELELVDEPGEEAPLQFEDLDQSAPADDQLAPLDELDELDDLPEPDELPEPADAGPAKPARGRVARSGAAKGRAPARRARATTTKRSEPDAPTDAKAKSTKKLGGFTRFFSGRKKAAGEEEAVAEARPTKSKRSSKSKRQAKRASRTTERISPAAPARRRATKKRSTPRSKSIEDELDVSLDESDILDDLGIDIDAALKSPSAGNEIRLDSSMELKLDDDLLDAKRSELDAESEEPVEVSPDLGLAEEGEDADLSLEADTAPAAAPAGGNGQGGYSVFLSKVKAGQREDAIQILMDVKGVDQKTASSLSGRMVIPVLKGVSKEEAETALGRFRKAGISGRITQRLR